MIIRILRALIVAAAFVGMYLYAPGVLELSTGKVESAERVVSAKDLTLTCSGSAFTAGGSSGTSTSKFSRLSSTAVALTYSGASGTKLKGLAGKQTTGYGIRQDQWERIKQAQSLTISDSTGKASQGSMLLTASQLQYLGDKKIKGLLAAPCLRSQSEFWLVGGSVAVGREAILILTNPTAVDATVDLEIFTENGISNSAGLSGIAVPAGSTEVIPLASFVFRSESMAVHVKSFGGSVTALIQQKAVRGLKASGADYIYPTGVAQKESVFPGILIRRAMDSAKLRKLDDKYSDVRQNLRVFVPGDKDAQITLEVLGTDEETFGTVVSVTAPAGKVTDFGINGLADGDYVGYLRSDQEVFSSIRLVRSRVGDDAYTDFAWINPAEGFTSPRYLAVPKAGISKLSIANPSSEATQVSLKFGEITIERNIAAGAEIVLLAPSGQSIGIFPTTQPVYSNLVVDVDGRIATLPVLDEKNLGGQVWINVH